MQVEEKPLKELAPALAQAFGGITALFGAAALTGWAADIPLLTTFAAGRIPMAPSTALLFLLFGAGAALSARSPFGLTGDRVTLALGAAGLLAALTLFALSLMGVHPRAEHLGMRIAGAVNGAPVGHMSPLTAFCFMLAGVSLLLALMASTRRPPRAAAAFAAGFAIIVISMSLLLAYFYSAPFLYGSGVIPPALTTSLAFLSLGVALCADAGLRAWPYDPRKDTQGARATYLLILLFILSAAGIVTAGHLYFREFARQSRAEVEQRLSAIAELKVNELEQYRKERLADAYILYRNPSIARMTRRYFENPQDALNREALVNWLFKFQSHYQYDRLVLMDARGAVRLSIPEHREPVSSVITARIPEVARAGQVVFQDFYRSEHNQRIYLSMLVPIHRESGGDEVAGVLAMKMDPAKYLYSLMLRWPAPSASAETLLVRREGAGALFLNELRFQPGSALNLRATAEKGAPAAMAAADGEGIIEGPDYRGETVVAAVQSVPGSPWRLVAKMDTAEAFAPLREQLWRIVGLVSALLLCTGAGAALIWRQQRLRFFQERYEAQLERVWLYDVIARSLNEIFMFDAATLRYTFANAEALRNLGYSADEMGGLGVPDVMPGTPKEALALMLEPLRSGARAKLVFESGHRRKNGSRYPVEIHLQLAAAPGGAVFLALCNDITERKKSEAELINKEAALRASEEASRLKDEFLAMISHELRNPFTSIIGFAERIPHKIEQNQPGKAVEFAQNISRSAERMLAILNDLLDIAKIEAGRITLLFGAASLAQAFDDIRSEMSLAIESKGLSLEVDLPPNLPLARADRQRLRQILANLISNAVKFTPKGGAVRLGARHDGDYVTFWVEDTGIGVSPEDQMIIFDRFRQVERGRKEQQGTGLGLAITKSLVELHHGRIWLESRPGSGTTFYVALPVWDEGKEEGDG